MNQEFYTILNILKNRFKNQKRTDKITHNKISYLKHLVQYCHTHSSTSTATEEKAKKAQRETRDFNARQRMENCSQSAQLMEM